MSKTQQITRIALYTALALILSYVEALVPIPIPIPGIKLGLPNVMILFALQTLNTASAFLILIFRILLSGFLFGSMSSILYALSGGLLSFIGMTLLCRYRDRLSLSFLSISIAGAVLHNTGQLITASLVVQNAHLFLSYAPILLIAALITGGITGIIDQLLIKYLHIHKL